MRRKTELMRQNQTTTEGQKKLHQMMHYIERQGQKKEEEIEKNSEEEYNMVKWNTIQTEKLKISKEYEAKEIRSKQEHQTEHGKIMHITQMRIIENKLKIFDVIENDVRKKIEKDMSNNKLRLNVLRSLIMEGLFKLLEKEVVIKCRKIDIQLIESVLPNIQEDYEEATHKIIMLRMDNTFLSNDCLPGVICKTPNNRISVNNTLDDRLKQVLKSSLPVPHQLSLLNLNHLDVNAVVKLVSH